jgi:hypothetical protein
MMFIFLHVALVCLHDLGLLGLAGMMLLKQDATSSEGLMEGLG